MSRGSITLGDLVGKLTMLEIACELEHNRGLLPQNGSDTTIIKWTCLLIALLGGMALLSQVGHAEPYSCQMYREAARKCAANTIGKCYVEAEMERLRKQCLRDGGNP
jgi:hypothetical protein